MRRHIDEAASRIARLG